MRRLIFFLWFTLLHISSCAEGNTHLTINLITSMNGGGQQADRYVLEEALKDLGCTVQFIERSNPHPVYPADINIFIEEVFAHIFPFAAVNWYIPNPEWCFTSPGELEAIDLILCRTREVQCIFKELHKKTFFLGFTTKDAKIKNVHKDFASCIHVAGLSSQKGTYAVLETWLKNAKLPPLTIIRRTPAPVKNLSNFIWVDYRLPLEHLRILQNQAGIHLCISETEGYGHYLMEAMSCGAVILTTDAPPMNEFILDKRCLVPYRRKAKQQLAWNYYVSAEDLELYLKRLLYLPKKELQAIGQANRMRYHQLQTYFQQRLQVLIDDAKTAKRLRNAGY